MVSARRTDMVAVRDIWLPVGVVEFAGDGSRV
jgi:hypothetical protein